MGRLSPRAKQIVEMILKEGLGAVVYYYPTVPIRVAHLDNELGDGAPASFRARLDSLQRGEINPSPTIEKWIDQVARMLATGFLPGSIDSIGVGHCLEAQNAVIDGGFVDLGSMVPMTEVIDDNRFHECLMAACCDLAKTIRTFLLGGQEEALAEYRNPSLTMAAIITRVTTDLQRRLEVYAGTISIDPRLTVFYEQCNSWEYYQKMLTALHPSHEGSQHA